MIAERVQRIQPSFTLEMTARAADLRNNGVDVIDLGVGEPDFNTPENIRQAAIRAMAGGHTKYTPGRGTMELREAICKKLKRDNNLDYTPNQIIVSNGAKHSLSTLCQAVLNPGDKVIVFAPYWVSFPEFIRLADGEPIIVQTMTENNFSPDWNDLESKVTSKISAIIINSPSNPTGAVWDKETVTRLLELAAKHNWLVISDECYERLVYDAPFTSTEALNDVGANVVTIQSLSKTYAMTGWRIGYAAGDATIVSAMAKIQGQATSCPNSIAQKAAVEALTGDQTEVETMCKIFAKRRDVMINRLNSIPNFSCAKPGGAFYAFPDVSQYIGLAADGKIINSSFALSDYILDSAKTVTVAGSGFGSEGYIRLSYATDEAVFLEGIDMLEKALSDLN
ncbi:MAG TPA: pyridoxal phosphate-dependent aminotransferase [Candidatus Marinimicrobia bacterium]|jgi:aspartate aminotransferase|nr:pyridoxal phosphate-dependent aminotransferase [Candidatus Neomarinimicrobiota bacterium]